MDKQIILKTMARLTERVPSLRWIEPEEGQLYALSRPPIDLPACLIDLAYTQCVPLDTHARGQRVTAELRLTLVFGYEGEAYAHAPEEIRRAALGRYDTLEEVHRALQGWTGEGLWSPMNRTRCLPSLKRQDNLKVFEAVYTMVLHDFVEEEAEEAWQTTSFETETPTT